MHLKQNIKAAMAAALIGAAGAAPATTLIMQAFAEARGPQVLLRELVQNHDLLPQDWGSRAVIAAPEPGKTKHVPIASIAYALQQYPDMSDVTLRGTPNTAVRRLSASLDTARISRAVEQYIAAQEQWHSSETQVVFENLAKIDNLPAGQLGVRVNHHRLMPGNDGTCAFDLTITSDGLPARRHTINAKVFVMRDMWVTARMLRRGQVLGEGDVEACPMPWHEGSQGIPADEPIAGLEVSRNLQPGQAVYRQLLMEPVCAGPGDLIEVIAQTGGLQVKLQARALSTGRRGDRIMCMNETSRRRMLVRLTAPRLAIIEIPSLSRKE